MTGQGDERKEKCQGRIWTGQDRASADRSEQGGSSLSRISRAGPVQDNGGVRAREG